MRTFLFLLLLFGCNQKKELSYRPQQFAYIKVPSETMEFEQEPDEIQVRFIELLNEQGKFEAEDVSAEFEKREFSPVGFQGKKFPGDDGDCSSIIFRNRSCRVALEIFSALPGRFVDELTVWYNNGLEKTGKKITINTLIGEEARLGLTIQGHSGLDLGAFEGDETRSYEFVLKNNGTLSAKQLQLTLQGVEPGVTFKLLSHDCPTKLLGGQSCSGRFEASSKAIGPASGQLQASYYDHRDRSRAQPFFLQFITQDVRGDLAWITRSDKARFEHDFRMYPHTISRGLRVRFMNRGIRKLSPKTISFLSENPTTSGAFLFELPEECRTVAPGASCEVRVELPATERPLGTWSGHLVVDYETSKPSEPMARSSRFPLRGESLFPPSLQVRQIRSTDDGLVFPVKCESLKTCSQSFIVTNQAPGSTAPNDAFRMVSARISELKFTEVGRFRATTSCPETIEYFAPCILRLFFDAPETEGLHSRTLDMHFVDATSLLPPRTSSFKVSASSIRKGVLEFGSEFTALERALDVGYVKLEELLQGAFTIRNSGVGEVRNLTFATGQEIPIGATLVEDSFEDLTPGLRANFIPGECERTETGVTILPGKECRFDIAFKLSAATRAKVAAFSIDQTMELSWSTGLESSVTTRSQTARVDFRGGFSSGLPPRWRVANGDLTANFRVCEGEVSGPDCFRRIGEDVYEANLGAFNPLDESKLAFSFLANQGQRLQLQSPPEVQVLSALGSIIQDVCPGVLDQDFSCDAQASFVTGQEGTVRYRYRLNYRDFAFRDLKTATFEFIVARDFRQPWFELRVDDQSVAPNSAMERLTYRATDLRKGYQQSKTFRISNPSLSELVFRDLFVPTTLSDSDAEVVLDASRTTCGTVNESGISEFRLAAGASCDFFVHFISRSWIGEPELTLVLDPDRGVGISPLAYSGLSYRISFRNLPMLRPSLTFSSSAFVIGDSRPTPAKYLRVNFGNDYAYPAGGPMRDGLAGREVVLESHLVPSKGSSPFGVSSSSCVLPHSPPFSCDIPVTLNGLWDLVGPQDLKVYLRHITGEFGEDALEEFEYELAMVFEVKEPNLFSITQLSFTKDVRLSALIEHPFRLPESMRSHVLEYQFEDFPKRLLSVSAPQVISQTFESVTYPTTEAIEDKLFSAALSHPCPEEGASSRICRYTEQAYFQVYPANFSFMPTSKKLKVVRSDPECEGSITSSKGSVRFAHVPYSGLAARTIVSRYDESQCDLLMDDDRAYRLCVAGGGLYRVKGWKFETGALIPTTDFYDWVPMRYQGRWEGYECMYDLLE